MKDHDLLADLDDRADRAAADVSARADARPRPAFDARHVPSAPAPTASVSRRPSRRPVLAVAAAFLIAVGGVGWWAARPDHDSSAPLTTTTDQVRPFQATWLPPRLRLLHAYEAGAGSSGRARDALAVELYGPNDGEPGLGVAVAPKGALTQDGSAVEQVDLGDGRKADWYDVSGLGRPLLVLSSGDLELLLIAPGLDRAQVISIARGATVGASGAVLAPASLPDGWARLGVEPNLVAAVNPLAATTIDGPLRLSYYGVGVDGSSAEGTGATVVISSQPGDEIRVASSRLFLQGVHEVSVRGHQGLVGHLTASPDNGSSIRTLAWLERPGELVRLAGTDVSEADLVRVAEGLKVVDEATWRSLVLRSQLGDYQEDPVSEIGRGEFADGSPWVVRIDGEVGAATSTRLAVATHQGDSSPASSSGSSSSSSGSEGPFRSVETLDQGGRYFASGLLSDEVASVELRSGTGSVLGRAEIVSGHGERAWVAELAQDPTVVVALDASGRELGRRTLDQLADNVTPGDGTGSPTTIAGVGESIPAPGN